MPVYLLTFHAYRTWLPDNERGYVRREDGVVPRNPERAEQYDRQAVQDVTYFDGQLQRILIDSVIDICSRRNWRLHGVGTDKTHLHILLSWADESLPWNEVSFTLKRLLGMLLAKGTGERGRRWFSRGQSRKRIRDRRHFDHLMTHYLPKHSGRCWFERR